MNNLKTVIANRLRAARESAGYTQAEIADLLKIERGSYTLIETGKNALRVEHLVKLCSILGKSPQYFLGLPSKINGLDTDESAIVDLYRALPAALQSLALATLRAWLRPEAEPPPVEVKTITGPPELPPGVDRELYDKLLRMVEPLTESQRYELLVEILNRRAARLAGETPEGARSVK